MLNAADHLPVEGDIPEIPLLPEMQLGTLVQIQLDIEKGKE